MNYENKISYTIKAGDNLYEIARFYDTEVQVLLEDNAPIDPFNLKIGSIIYVYPGKKNREMIPIDIDKEEDTLLTDAQDLRDCGFSGGFYEEYTYPIQQPVQPNYYYGNQPDYQQSMVQINQYIDKEPTTYMPYGQQGYPMQPNQMMHQQPVSNYQTHPETLMYQPPMNGYQTQSMVNPYGVSGVQTQMMPNTMPPMPYFGGTQNQMMMTPQGSSMMQTQNYPHMQRSSNKQSLESEMRILWFEHIIWTRAVIVSMIDNLKDVQEVTSRLLKNPRDIADFFEPYYDQSVADQIALLFTDHLTLAAQLITALKENNQALAEDINRKWYKNAQDIASYFATLSPYYDELELRNMMFEHLAFVTNEVQARFDKNYAMDIANFDAMEEQALHMADYFVNGIIKQKGMYVD